jgi:uncharacterized protein (TIGR03000 family)
VGAAEWSLLDAVDAWVAPDAPVGTPPAMVAKGPVTADCSTAGCFMPSNISTKPTLAGWDTVAPALVALARATAAGARALVAQGRAMAAPVAWVASAGVSPILSYGMGMPGMGSSNPYYENGGFWGTPDRGSSYVSGVWQGTSYPGHLGGYGGYIGGGSAWGPVVAMPSYSLYGQANPPAIYGAPNAIYHPVVKMTAPEGGDPKQPEDKKPEEMKQPEEPGKTSKTEKVATLKFVVPAETKLYVDGRLTTVGGTERTFATPPLPLGQKFYYDVKAELMINGTAVIEEKRVIVQAGADISETFTKLVTAAETQARIVAGK